VIVDFSPEWDYTTGGSKLLVCIRPSINTFLGEEYSSRESEFECSFGDTVVPIRFVQPGVFKCNTPPHEAGFVPLNLLYKGEVISVK